MPECQFFIPRPTEEYVAAAMGHHQRLFEAHDYASTGVGRNQAEGCDHFKVFIQVGRRRDPRKQIIFSPCFQFELEAQTWRSDVTRCLTEMLQKAGARPQRFGLN